MQFRQFVPDFAFAFSQFFRHVDLNFDVKIATLSRDSRQTPFSQTKPLTALVPGGIFRRTFPSRVGTSNSLPSTARHGSIFTS